jgi:hypothetical protein
MFYTTTTTTKTGKQNGYAVKSEAGETVATFRNKDHGYWRFAKTAAEREADRLNRQAEQGG